VGAACGTPAFPLPLVVSDPFEEAIRGVGVDEQRAVKPAAAEISTEAVGVLREYTGRGPTKARTMINEDVVTVLLADTLTKGERRLAESGHAARILELRHDFQQVMRDDLIAIVERHLERKVIAFMSQNHIDPDLAVEVFVLEPAKV
jgi:uncharacterized protein YbcI